MLHCHYKYIKLFLYIINFQIIFNFYYIVLEKNITKVKQLIHHL